LQINIEKPSLVSESFVDSLKRYSINRDFERDFFIFKKIGFGAYSTVFEAQSRRNKERVAVKVMRKETFKEEKHKI
jgi:serine/threonine protein kinase